MSRMAEQYQEQQEQENESGIDMHDCYHACHPLARREDWHHLDDSPSKGSTDNERSDHGKE